MKTYSVEPVAEPALLLIARESEPVRLQSEGAVTYEAERDAERLSLSMTADNSASIVRRLASAVGFPPTVPPT
ncbi:hypothetical protein FE156_04575 [Streptomyces albidoflavus]|nr:hypothetical protein FE156_04575 [Streptomyces albidoflavus]